jgi:hypothetical protein
MGAPKGYPHFLFKEQGQRTTNEEVRNLWYIRVIRKVRQTQHQNREFGHSQGEIKKKPAKKYISIQWGGGEGEWGETQKTINFGSKLSFILSFLFPERLHCCYIYFHCSYLLQLQ